ncbi:hypothetical protein PACTADRAFT_47537 [Pachysolen tannophilus NRRL Y-2460]|uniref:PHD-type domain-containing protein n=1 Tax=Pachysolen tannophilus NRRL Y-2460 TaxID=669874 RepID=A0A1E4U128_PACTA|nr:hypothetical protein PACTADRAFT_47537 [Pachysolen tannophilus NRRL Y-2460]
MAKKKKIIIQLLKKKKKKKKRKTKDNDDFCSACGGSGIFLCCESCPKSFHFLCCDPPFDDATLPEGSWYCNECKAKYSKPKKYKVGIFSKLLNQCELRNPRRFQLPRKLRESTFENITTGKFGEYRDNSMKPEKQVKIGKLEESDPINIYDKNGAPLLCYKCGKSGLEKQIVKCEYCDLSWHLDCLTPPLPAIKTLGTKWKCPNHSDDLSLPHGRRFKKSKILDVSLLRGFKNNGDVEILNLEDEDYENVVQLPTPDYFNSYYKAGEIHAPVCEELEKIVTMNNIVYRIPERGIILDFIDNAKIRKVQELEKMEKSNHEIIQKIGNDETKKNYIASLAEFKKQQRVQADFEELVNISIAELEKNAKTADKAKQINSIKDFNDNELKELINIKKLIELKGKDRLLEFLIKE